MIDVEKRGLINTKNELVLSHGYATFVKDQIEQLAPQFTNVTVLARHNPISELSNTIPLQYLTPYRKASIIDLSNKPSNVNVIITPIIYLPTDRQYKKLGDKHFRAVEKAIKNGGITFDLIHSQFTWSAGYVGAKLKEKHGLPFVVTARGYDIYDLPFRDDEWREKIEYVLNAADYIITVSNSNLECIKQLNVKTEVRVIPNGFRSDLFYPRNLAECRKKLNLPLSRRIILNVGAVYDEVKGGTYLIEAMKEVIKRKKDVLCIIIGSGKLKNKLEKQIKKAGLENYVKLIGGRAHTEIPLWMNACDVFVLPSLNEGNPNVMFEALGCGKPFVGTKVGGVPEIINSDDYGLLVEPTNPNELAEKIVIALDKQWDNDKIIRYAEQFRIENKAKVVLEVYEKVTGG